MLLKLSPNGKIVSDYEVESCYQTYKTAESVSVATVLLFDRFRLGHAQGDFEELTIVIEEANGTVSVQGQVPEVHLQMWRSDVYQLGNMWAAYCKGGGK